MVTHGSHQSRWPTTEEPAILWLGDPGSDATPVVGGKAANLSLLAAAYPVPRGFCVTTHATAAIDERGIPLHLERRIHSAYQALGERLGEEMPRVAVRSSAVDEDGAQASFAGQHDTYLNVRGPDSVMRAIQRCRASVFSQHAQHYRRQRGLAGRDYPLAVLVQHLVVADVSAVVFSAHPVTGDRDQILINASWGLGESIVGGTVTPDTFVVRKHDLRIDRRQRGEKRRMTILTTETTQEVDVPRLLRDRYSLSDDQLVRIAHLARDLETRVGWPVDVECALQGDALYVLQCRRITTLGE